MCIAKFIAVKCLRLRVRNPVLSNTLLLIMTTLTFSLFALGALVLGIISSEYRSSCPSLIVSSLKNVASRRGVSAGFRKSKSSRKSAPLSPALGAHFLVNANHLCDAHDVDDLNVTSFPLYLIIVHSRPDETGQAQRDAIRATWASSTRHVNAEWTKKHDFRVVFVVGRPTGVSNRKHATKLNHESELYGDIVVADFVDNYRNLTIKSLIGMRWARTWCATAHYVIKVDDDVYLRVDLLPAIVNRQRQRIVLASDNDTVIVGSLNVNATVHRHGLWRVNRTAFPADRFPPYCSGNVYMMTSAAVDRLLSAAENASVVDPFPLEDVFVTSILAASSGMHCYHDDVFPYWYIGPTENNVWRMRVGELVAVHNVDYRRMYKVERKLYD